MKPYGFIFCSYLGFLQLPILALKLQIACVSGVIPELQRLLFRGRVLKYDQLLSDYRILPFFLALYLMLLCFFFFFQKRVSLNELIQDIEQGHTLYFVVRPRLSQRASSNAGVYIAFKSP